MPGALAGMLCLIGPARAGALDGTASGIGRAVGQEIARRIGLAVEAAQAGFDEIQFDYERFPDAAGVIF